MFSCCPAALPGPFPLGTSQLLCPKPGAASGCCDTNARSSSGCTLFAAQDTALCCILNTAELFEAIIPIYLGPFWHFPGCSEEVSFTVAPQPLHLQGKPLLTLHIKGKHFNLRFALRGTEGKLFLSSEGRSGSLALPGRDCGEGGDGTWSSLFRASAQLL